jgi:hypothetical protein
MSRNLYVARSPRVAARKMGNEMMIMSGRDSTLFTLDEVATIIWEASDGSTPLEEIVASRICTQFEVERSAALADAEGLVEELAGHGILFVSREPLTEPKLLCQVKP